MPRPAGNKVVKDSYGDWTVIKKISNRFVRVRCVCGTEADRRLNSLEIGDSTSCGCSKRVKINRYDVVTALNSHSYMWQAANALFVSMPVLRRLRKNYNIIVEGGRYV